MKRYLLILGVVGALVALTWLKSTDSASATSVTCTQVETNEYTTTDRTWAASGAWRLKQYITNKYSRKVVEDDFRDSWYVSYEKVKWTRISSTDNWHPEDVYVRNAAIGAECDDIDSPVWIDEETATYTPSWSTSTQSYEYTTFLTISEEFMINVGGENATDFISQVISEKVVKNTTQQNTVDWVTGNRFSEG